MAVNQKYRPGPGGYYDTTDGSGPYAIDASGTAHLMGGGGGGPVDAATVNVAEITTAGGTVIPAGTLQDVLQAIADLADPAI